MKTVKRILIFIALAVVAAGVVYLVMRNKERKEQVGYETVPVRKGTISNTVTATGTIEPIIQVEVGTQVSGIIDHIYVDYNSVVTEGQILAELDKTTLEAELASSTATLESSKTEYEYQQKNYARIKGLHDKSMVSDTDFETAEYQYEKAKSAYEKAQSDIKKVRQNLSYATIYSPIDGVVLDRAVDEGQTVAASFNTPTLFTIAKDLRQMQVIADVDEADIGSVEDGQPVTFTVDAFPDDVFKGNITQVRLQPTTTSNVVTYEVVIDAPNPDLKLKPGLTANITIFTMEKNNVLLVPSKALRFNPEGVSAQTAEGSQPVIPVKSSSDTVTVENHSKSVWMMDASGKINPVQVKIGSTDGIYTEITEGVKEGDPVVTSLKLSVSSEAAPSGEESPFMPKRPGQKSTTKK